jgi:hypothetical protein
MESKIVLRKDEFMLLTGERLHDIMKSLMEQKNAKAEFFAVEEQNCSVDDQKHLRKELKE